MFNLSLEATGLELMQEKLKMTAKLGSTVANAELNSVPREEVAGIPETGATNREILDHLLKQKRDFISTYKEEREQIAKAYIKEFEKQWAKHQKPDGNPARRANAIDMAGFRAAMRVYMGIVYNRILDGKGFGAFNGTLSEEYAEWKKKAVGFAYPIGKLTEQLLENVNPAGSTTGRIKVNKR